MFGNIWNCVLFVVLCSVQSRGDSVQRNFLISLPTRLYVEHGNDIQVRTINRASAVNIKTIIPQLEFPTLDENTYKLEPLGERMYGVDIRYSPTILPPNGQPTDATLNFTVTFCNNDECTELVNETRSEVIQLVRRPLLVLGEIEKPMYRPGETVRLRFLALTPQFTVPLQVPLTYPKRKLVRVGSNRFELQDINEDDWHKLHRVEFEEIAVIDSKENRVKQWFNLGAAAAATLNYTLLVDAPEGEWSVTAQTRDQSERMAFSVKQYVLPRFVIEIKPPTDLAFTSSYTTFEVCAKYTNGPPMLGLVRAVICVCERPVSGSTGISEQQSIMENRSCPKSQWTADPRPCVQAQEILQMDGCSMFNVSTRKLDFANPRRPNWGQSVVVCSEVIEEGTGSNVTKCEDGKNLDLRRQRLSIQFPSVYKAGLPVYGTVTVENFDSAQAGKAHVRLSLSEQRNGCWWSPRIRPSYDKSAYRYVTKKTVNIDGKVEFFIPPILSNRTISLKATFHVKDEKPDKDQAKSATSAEFLVSRIRDDSNLAEYQTLRPFISDSKSVVQQWPTITHAQVKCPGTVSMKLIANTPLEDKTIFVRSVVRGQSVHETIIPSSADKFSCVDQNGLLGHYTCVDAFSSEVNCLPGWTGQDCLRPICATGCHPQGGSCEIPGTCVCNDGWAGDLCNVCVSIPGCVHGKCVEGDDCVCDSGWVGYLCDRAEVIYERVPESDQDQNTTSTEEPVEEVTTELESEVTEKTYHESTVSSRTLHVRDITFSIDQRWGPEATVLIYFHEETDDGYVIVPTVVTLKDIENCTSPASVVQSESNENGFDFNTYHASPGQKLNLTLKLKGLSEVMVSGENGMLSDQVCFVRISDISLSSFEESNSVLNLHRYATKLQDIHRDWVTHGDQPTDVREAFQAAGLRLVSNKVTEHVYLETYACPRMYAMSRSAPVLDSEPMRSSEINFDRADSGSPPKPRLRDFFPEVWVFDVIAMEQIDQIDGIQQYGVQKSLIAPDTITTWRSSAFCTTQSHGLWIPPEKHLTVSMPFFVEITLPKQVKRGEILYLPVSVFVAKLEDDLSEPSGCLEIDVTTEIDDDDWVRFGSSRYSGCVCPGQKETFQLGLVPKRFGQLNVTALAYASFGSALCNADASSAIAFEGKRLLSDMVRRQVRVVPEGSPKETTVGTMLCLKPGETETHQEFPIALPPNIISGSLRLYVSYSDVVLGPALRNLDQLIRLPVGCGEQNMLLVAPNVYVLDYLKSVPVVNRKETERLIREARSHVLSGYERQLKYRLNDGSYSAFGQSDGEGSTWLTAFVLRVFAKAYKVDPSIAVDWIRLMNETTRFLTSRTESDGSGCFVEKGRVIHAAMQGGLGSSTATDKTLLLTSYVLAALFEMNDISKFARSAQLVAAFENAGKCLVRHLQVKVNETESMQQFGTYELAQITYTMTLLYQHDTVTRNLQHELLKRQQAQSTGGSGTRSFWTANEKNNFAQSAESTDIETTSYAYLTLTYSDPPLIDPFSVVRWLSSQQTSSGGFRSTQDTVLALQVIADGAKRLNIADVGVKNDRIEVAAKLVPSGDHMIDIITEEKRRVLNQFPIAFEEGKPIDGFQWTVKRGSNVGVQCLAIQNILYYNVPDSVVTENNAFAVSVNIEQPETMVPPSCTTATMTICVRPSLNASESHDSGMILVQLFMVSGWRTLQDSLFRQVGNKSESVRKVEFDDEGTTSLYFDRFTDPEANVKGGWDNLKRCFTVELKQLMYVEKSEPAKITVKDYYTSERDISTTYSLDSCKSSWGIEDGVIAEPETTESTLLSTTLKPLKCPTCAISSLLKQAIVDVIITSLCDGHSNLYLFHVDPTDKYRVTVTTVNRRNYTASWNATLNAESLRECPCSSITNSSKLILLAPSSTDIYEGMPEIGISYVPSNTMLVSVQDLLPSIEEAMGRWSNDQIDKSTPHAPVSSKGWGCDRIAILHRYIKHKFL